jgi:hypothetical protein
LLIFQVFFTTRFLYYKLKGRKEEQLRKEIFKIKKHLFQLNEAYTDLSQEFGEQIDSLADSMQRDGTHFDSMVSIFTFIGQLRHPLPLESKSSVSPEALNLIINEIIVKKPELIIEVGSGYSTIIIGYCLERNGKGKLLALEHSKGGYEMMSNLIESHQLKDHIDLVFCPLKVYNLDDKDYLWYAFDLNTIKDRAQMLVINGPPPDKQKNIRYPAVPLMYDHLADVATIYFEGGEREVVNMWIDKYFDLKPVLEETEKGLYILERP